MSEKNREELANVEDVEIDALTDEDLEDVAGGLARDADDDCTCAISSSNCSNGSAVY